jgi:MYXO-CTERM domain-containing protein
MFARLAAAAPCYGGQRSGHGVRRGVRRCANDWVKSMRTLKNLRAASIASTLSCVLACSSGEEQAAQGPDRLGTVQGDAPAPAALAQIRMLRAEQESRSPAERKMSSQLVLAAKRHRGDPSVAALSGMRSNTKLSASGTVRVDIKGEVDEALLARIRALGGEVVASVPRFDAVQAELPLLELEALAGEHSVRSIMPALGWQTRKVNTSEGDFAHGVDAARSKYGVDGSGVTVGVLSDGVDTLSARKATGDLPASPQLKVLAGQSGDGDEGTAMLEIVHDLAPGADLLFATALPSAAQFAQNILDLRAAGADIIVDDVIYLAEAAFQDDVVAQAVDAVTADGALYLSAAGNDGNLNDGTSGGYEADYLPSSVLSGISNSTYDGVHDFGGGAKSNALTWDPPGYITFQWSDPFNDSTNDYDIFLFDQALETVVDSSTTVQDGSGSQPLEFLDSSEFNDEGNQLVIARRSGEAARVVRICTHGGELAVKSASQIWGHSAAESAFAVGAVDIASAGQDGFEGGSENPVEWFSSDGPRRIFFDADGDALTPGNLLSSGGVLRQKPEFAAADGVATATPGFNPFHGTSAAAPHGAALMALLLEVRPDIAELGDASASSTVLGIVATSSLDIEAAGYDRDSGHGILMPDALLNQCYPEGAGCDDGNACTHTDTCQQGACVGSDPVVCEASDACHVAGSCNADTGLCSNPNAAKGTPCEGGECRTGKCEPLDDGAGGAGGAGGNEWGTTEAGAGGQSSGGTTTTGGTGGSGGNAGIGGGGTSTGGMPASAGSAGSSAGGTDAVAGGNAGTTAGGTSGKPPTKEDDEGCGCRVPGPAQPSPRGALFALLGGLVLAVRRRRVC